MKFVAVAALVLLAGCAESGPELEVNVEGEADGDNPVRIVAVLELDKPLTYNHPGCSPDLFEAAVVVPSITLREYGVEPQLSICMVSEVTLAPGTYSQSFDWNGRSGSMDGGEPHNGTKVEPGEYDVRVQLRGLPEQMQTVSVRVI